jgi:hypothetical protein
LGSPEAPWESPEGDANSDSEEEQLDKDGPAS